MENNLTLTRRPHLIDTPSINLFETGKYRESTAAITNDSGNDARRNSFIGTLYRQFAINVIIIDPTTP